MKVDISNYHKFPLNMYQLVIKFRWLRWNEYVHKTNKYNIFPHKPLWYEVH